MSKIKLTNVPFTGTAKQESELRAAMQSLKNVEGSLMPALQAAQGIYGYLPIEVQKIVAAELKVPLEEIFGVATFYSQFTLNPRGKYTVSVCLGTACYVKGSNNVLDKIKESLKLESGECSSDRKFSLLETRCIGCCGLAPVFTVNDDVYGKVNVKDIPGILAKYN
ncbi:MAG TPA: NAD(P)H-dependent oxidoreductase subunit E [Clostridia bacterium]|nr:NAD(P)H-dependent oxidoreductase subunit E [Clostridia bacterium]